MKLAVILLSVLSSVFLVPQQDQQRTTYTLNPPSVYYEVDRLIQTLHQPDVVRELELSRDQRTQVSRFQSDGRMLVHNFIKNTAGKDEETKEIYQKRLAEDFVLMTKKLQSEILLPHQSELFEKIHKQKTLEADVASGFTRIKGTELEKLDLTEKQLEKLAAIRIELQDKLKEERKRHLDAIQRIKDESIAGIRDSMTREQRETLEIE